MKVLHLCNLLIQDTYVCCFLFVWFLTLFSWSSYLCCHQRHVPKTLQLNIYFVSLFHSEENSCLSTQLVRISSSERWQSTLFQLFFLHSFCHDISMLELSISFRHLDAYAGNFLGSKPQEPVVCKTKKPMPVYIVFTFKPICPRYVQPCLVLNALFDT